MSALVCPICGVPSVLRCAGCKTVVYCSREHQIKDWKNGHKKICKCYELAQNELLGRYIKAKRDINPGEIILKEKATVIGPKVASMPLCLGCHKLLPEPKPPMVNFYKCSRCNWPLCGPLCEKSTFHINECKIMAANNFKPKIEYDPKKYEENKKESAYCAILPLRVMLLRKYNPKIFAKIINLEDHLEQRINTPLYQVLCQNLLTFCKTVLGLNDWENHEIMRIAGILDTNAFEIRQHNPNRKVRAIYPEAAMLSHDCLPNARHVFDENMSIIFIATKNINKGEIISISYTQPLWCTVERQRHLSDMKCFVCQCKRCLDPTELDTYAGSILCSRCKIGKICPKNPLNITAIWQCNNCDHTIQGHKMYAGNMKLKLELVGTETKTIDSLENFIKKYSDILHPTNTHMLQAKYALTQLYGTSNHFPYFDTGLKGSQRKIKICKELLEVAEKIDPGWSELRGNLLFSLQEPVALKLKHDFICGTLSRIQYQLALKEPMGMLQEAYEILKFDASQESRVKEYLDVLEKEMHIDIVY